MAARKASARANRMPAPDELPQEPAAVPREELRLIREELADHGRRVAFSQPQRSSRRTRGIFARRPRDGLRRILADARLLLSPAGSSARGPALSRLAAPLDEYEQRPPRDVGRDARCSFDRRASSPAGSFRTLRTNSGSAGRDRRSLTEGEGLGASPASLARCSLERTGAVSHCGSQMVRALSQCATRSSPPATATERRVLRRSPMGSPRRG
jgi:hypothetical protein